jgi:hypothetical protein
VQNGTLGDYALAAETVFAVKVNGTTYYPGQYGIADLGNIGGTYELPLAADGTRGGIQIGFTTSASNRNYAVALSSEKAYVNVPWTDENVKVTTVDPSSSTVYYPLFYGSLPSTNATGGASANKGLKYTATSSDVILQVGYENSSSSARRAGSLVLSRKQYKATIEVSSSISADRTFTLPNNGGTFALTSDLSSYIPVAGSAVITGSLTPNNNNSVSLGTTANNWKEVNCKTLNVSGTASTTVINDTHIYNAAATLSIQGSSKGSKDLSLCAGGGGLLVGVASLPSGISSKHYVSGTTCFSTNVGVGGYNASYKLYVSGTACMTKLQVQGTTSPKEFIINWNADGYYEIGTTNSTNTEIDIAGKWYGSWQGSSDIRLKNVIDNVNVGIEKIADIPIFNFTWKDGRDKDLHLGTSAQYIQGIFPNAVSVMKAGTLGMDYGAAALAAAKLTARKVVDHEERIKRLEKLYLNKD